MTITELFSFVAGCIVVCVVAVTLGTCTYYQSVNSSEKNTEMMTTCTTSNGDWTTSLPNNYTYVCTHYRGR